MSKTTKSPDNTKKEEEVDFKRFIDISKWTIRILFGISKKLTITHIVTDILIRLDILANTYLVAKIFDQIIKAIERGDTNVNVLIPYMGILLGYNIVSSIIGYISEKTNQTLSSKIGPELDRKMYKHLHNLGLEMLEQPEMSNLVTRADRSIGSLISYFRQTTDLLATTISFVTTLFVVATFSPYLIPLILIGTIPGMLHDRKFRKIVWKFDIDKTEDHRKAYAIAGTLRGLNNLPEILINKAVTYLDKKFFSYITWYTDTRLDLSNKWILGNRSWNVLNELTIYVGYLLVFSKAIARKITIGDVYFQTRILQKLSGDFDRILLLITNLFEFSIRINDAYTLFTIEPKIKNASKKITKLDRGPKIEIKDLVFSYPNTDRKVLNKLNVTIKSGEKVALVGVNGAGKTTLMKLLCGIYDLTEGKILINGKDLANIELQSWYDNLGVLLQEYNTYPQLTVKENIILGNPNMKFNSKRMIEAANNASALEFINEFPNKFEQILSPNYKEGIRPSTGQWQKIAIARFFYRDAPLVIFDEPTASIDAVSEYNIFNKIYKFFKNKTVIIISHRFSTVRNADRILVLDKGKIIEDGTHEELLALGGNYAHSFNLQAQGYTS